MAAGLLNESNVTPNTLEKLIEHVSSSPNSSSNEHRQIPVNFVVSTPPLPIDPIKYDSLSLFLQVKCYYYNLVSLKLLNVHFIYVVFVTNNLENLLIINVVVGSISEFLLHT